MRARAVVAGVVVAALVVIATLPASAADVGRRGPLSIDVVGTFGEPRATAAGATVLPYHGQAVLSGLVAASAEVEGQALLTPPEGLKSGDTIDASAVGEDDPLAGGMFHAECTLLKTPGVNATQCTLGGAVTGRGALTRFDANPVVGGRLAFTIELPNAFCPR